MTSIASILTIAKQLLIDKGWGQGDYVKPIQGVDKYAAYDNPKELAACMCAAGAVYTAVDVPVYNTLRIKSPEGYAALQHLAHTVPSASHSASCNPDGVIAAWNDDPARSANQVLALFDAAIDSAPNPD